MEMTELNELFDKYINLNYESDDTRRSYKNCYKKFTFENSRIYRMSKKDLQDYFIEYGKRYSASYYNQMLSTVVIVFKLLKRPRIVNGIPFKKDKPKNIKILSRIGFVEKLNEIENIKHRCMIRLLYTGALRSKELLNIKISDVDKENHRIYINNGKGGKSRYVPICEDDLAELRVYFRAYRPQIYLFEGVKKGERYSKCSLRNVVKKIDERVYPHLLRHTALTNLIDDGHNQLKVQRFAGHETQRSTDRYYHLRNDALQGMILRTTPIQN